MTRNQEGPGKPSEAKEGKDWTAAMPDSSQGILRVTSLAFSLFFFLQFDGRALRHLGETLGLPQ